MTLDLEGLAFCFGGEGRDRASVTFLGHREEGGDGETGYGLEGWDAREACSRGHFQTQAQSQSLWRKAPPCWARSSSLATCAARQDLPAPAWGKRRGQSPEGGVDWCLDKVRGREEAELKAEDCRPGARIEAETSGAIGASLGPGTVSRKVRSEGDSWVGCPLWTFPDAVARSPYPLVQGCFLKGKAGGPPWGWLFLVAVETGSLIPSDHQHQASPQ